jgi:hypothetical protein
MFVWRKRPKKHTRAKGARRKAAHKAVMKRRRVRKSS